MTYSVKKGKIIIMARSDTAIIIVNWNGKEYLKSCLDSIKNQTHQDFHIFLVDNNSTDSSLETAKRYKNLTIIKNKENYGFAKGNNIGICEALKNGYKYVVLVNLDTVAEKNWLKNLVLTANEDSVGAVQSKILIYGSNLINSLGNDLHYLGFSYCGEYKKPDHPLEKRDITLGSGASLLLKADVLKKIGLMDENFFMYLEDADLSFRIWEAGWRVVVEPKSVIYHKYHFSRNKKKFYFSERNRLYFVAKNYGLKTIILLSPAFIAIELCMLVYSLFGGWIHYKIKSYFDFAINFRYILRERKKILSIKTKKDAELKHLMKSDLHFEEVKIPLENILNRLLRIYWFIFSRFI